MAESEADQIRFIDSFFDFRRFRREIETLKGEIAGLDGQVASQVHSMKQVVVLRKQLATLTAQIGERDKALASEVFGRYRTAQAKKQNLDSVAAALVGLRDVVANSRVAVDAVPDPPPADETVNTDPLIKRSRLRFTSSRALAATQLKTAQDTLDKSIQEQADDARQWQQQLDTLSASTQRRCKGSGAMPLPYIRIGPALSRTPACLPPGCRPKSNAALSSRRRSIDGRSCWLASLSSMRSTPERARSVASGLPINPVGGSGRRWKPAPT